MPGVLWTGKLSALMKLMVNMNNLMAWLAGGTRDTAAMKQRVRLGFEGTCTRCLSQYDGLGSGHFTQIATALLEDLEVRDERVLDVGCGTGILSFLALERGAARVIGGDFSGHMVERCREKVRNRGCPRDRADFLRLDAESLPFGGDCFDLVLSSMLLGMLPDQKRALEEMARVVRPGGVLALSTHGPDNYHEANDAGFRASTKFNFSDFSGYRTEYWALTQSKIQKMLAGAGLIDIRTRRLTAQERFESGAEAFDFYAATSGLWWYGKLPPERRAVAFRKTRDYFNRRKVKRITRDVVLARGLKP